MKTEMPPSHSNENSSLEIAQSSQDLINSKGKRKRRLYIIGTIAVLLVIAAVVALAVLLTGKDDADELIEEPNLPSLSLEDVISGRLNPKNFNATWISGNELLYRDLWGNIVIYNVTSKSTKELLPASSQILLTAFDYELSPDRQYLLIAHDYQKLYRHTYLARYSIVHVDTKSSVSLRIEENGNVEDVLQFASWGSEGNSIVYVVGNNIYFKPSALERYFAVTDDGHSGFIYNGVPDWVYEEEVFSSNKAVWFSPDGRRLAYAKFNDNATHIMTVPFYGTPGLIDSQYTKAVQIRYPKPGTTNPTVTLYIVDLEELTSQYASSASTISKYRGPLKDFYAESILTTVTWASNNLLSATWMNRVQNEAHIVIYDSNSDEGLQNPQTVKHLKQESGWLDIFTPPVFSSDGSELLLILSQEQLGGAGGFRHVTRFQRRENSTAEAITSGRFVVTEILNWNEEENLVYYQANTEEDPAVQHVYSVSTTTKLVTCISCGIISFSTLHACLYNSAKFSKDFSHYVLNCAGPGVPEVSLYSIGNNRIGSWENNEELLTVTRSKMTPTTHRHTFNIAGDFKAQVLLKLPPKMDFSGNTKYPMVVNVYGGPDSYQVLEKFNLDWGSYLAANKSIVYATIDGRGSGLKGDKILFSGYRRLGTVEIEDQINITRQIQQTLPYIDGSRTAIWGWSYGGYASGLALSKDNEGVFKCGMSVAPVTDWLLYDSIYTERFMGLPTAGDNAVGYDNANLLNKFEGLRGKNYFLVHGTFDDNVHYQQSMLWSKVLEHKDILFRQQSYPDEDHGLASVRPHLYHSLENFLDECFIKDIGH